MPGETMTTSASASSRNTKLFFTMIYLSASAEHEMLARSSCYSGLEMTGGCYYHSGLHLSGPRGH
jgi:hypothetical protein